VTPQPWVHLCRRCGRSWGLGDARWQCECGGLLDLHGPGADPIGETSPWSLWRYRSALPTGEAWKKVSLGEGMTPLVPIRAGLWCKLEYVSPTGSFKDRGAAVMLSLAADLGVQRVAVDSSGNAGMAVAAYAARAGMAAEVFVPAGTAETKVAAVVASGARLVTVTGDRGAVAAAARDAAAVGAWYASHVYRPVFVHGVKTLAFELWEQLGGRVPATVVVPAGNGTLVLGLWLGFRELMAHGRSRRLPALVAVQAARCAPLAGLPPAGSTAASGIAVAKPPRGSEVRAAVLASGGKVLTVSEAALAAAQVALARMGMRVEPTGAAAWAAHGQGGTGNDQGPVVVILSGGA
jgi:threonine synthase